MARSMTKNVTEVTTDNVDEVINNVINETKKKKFSNDDEIACISITPGQYFLLGERSKDLYTFADMDDIQYIRYDDLMYCVRRKHPSVFKPRIIIQDRDFLDQNPDIEKAYASLYSSADLKAILKLSPSQMKSKILSLPEGAKDSLKIIVTTMIDKGSFDSVQKIKVIDEIFGTDMLFKVTGN